MRVCSDFAGVTPFQAHRFTLTGVLCIPYCDLSVLFPIVVSSSVTCVVDVACFLVSMEIRNIALQEACLVASLLQFC